MRKSPLIDWSTMLCSASRALAVGVVLASATGMLQHALAGSTDAPKASPGGYPLPDAKDVFKPDIGKPYTQTGPRIETQPGSLPQPNAICGPGEVRRLDGRCVR